MVLGFSARVRALTLLVCLGCSERGAAFPTAPDPQPIESLPERYGLPESPDQPRIELYAERATRRVGGEILLTGPLSGAPAVSKSRSGVASVTKTVAEGLSAAPSAPAHPSAPTPEPTSPPQAGKELIDLEATLVLEASDIESTAARARALTRAVGGEIVTDTFEDNRYQAGYALSLRVP